jgi:hypothetical protein
MLKSGNPEGPSREVVLCREVVNEEMRKAFWGKQRFCLSGRHCGHDSSSSFLPCDCG